MQIFWADVCFPYLICWYSSFVRIPNSEFMLIFSLSYFYNCTKNSKSVSCLDFFYQEVTNSVTSLYMKFGIRNPEFGICYSFSNHGNYLVFVSEYLFSYSSTSKLRLVRLPTDVVGKVRCSAFHTCIYVIKSFKSFYASWILDCTRMRVAQYHLTLIK